MKHVHTSTHYTQGKYNTILLCINTNIHTRQNIIYTCNT